MAIDALSGSVKRRGRPPVEKASASSFDYTTSNVPDWVKPKAKTAPTRKKRKLSAAGRRAIIAATKKRWAAIRAAKAEAIAPSEDADFKSKMSEATKASWAKRKKAAKKKAKA